MYVLSSVELANVRGFHLSLSYVLKLFILSQRASESVRETKTEREKEIIKSW